MEEDYSVSFTLLVETQVTANSTAVTIVKHGTIVKACNAKAALLRAENELDELIDTTPKNVGVTITHIDIVPSIER